MKVTFTRSFTNEVDLKPKEILEYAIDVLKEDADLKYQWINQNGNLEYEEHTSHSYYVEKGKPSEKQIVANDIINLLKEYNKLK